MLLLCLLGGHVWKVVNKILQGPGAGAQVGARWGREWRPGQGASVWALGLPQRWRGKAVALHCTMVVRAWPVVPALGSRGGGATRGCGVAWSRCSGEAGTGGGVGGTSFATSGALSGASESPFLYAVTWTGGCISSFTRVAAAGSPLWDRVLEARAGRLHWTLLLWWRGGGPCIPGPRGPWLLPVTGLQQFWKVLGVSSSSLSNIFSRL